MSNKLHNIIWFMPTILITLPIRLFLLGLMKLGEWAEHVDDVVADYLPALKRTK